MPASAEIAGVQNPRLSPDGSRVAIVAEGNLWVQDLRGRPPIKLIVRCRALLASLEH